MQTIAIVEPVPAFFRSELQELGFALEDTTTQDLKDRNPEGQKGVAGLVIRSKTSVDAALMEALPQLAFIMRPGSGLDNVDRAAAAQQGIHLITSPEGNRNAVAEHALGLLLSLLHNIPRASAAVREGRWEREPNRGTELRDLEVGIIGYGHTGRAFAHKLSGTGCRITAYDKYAPVPFADAFVGVDTWEALSARADVLSFHVPYTTETHHYFSQRLVQARHKPLILINTSRGGVIGTHDLLSALEKGSVSGACLDVLETEDVSKPDQALLDATEALKKHQNVLITPHIAGWSYTSEQAIYHGLLAKLASLYNLG